MDGETFALGDGRTLEIRPTSDQDASRLAALFDGLSNDDVHLRFFSAVRPRGDWCRQWATVADRGGFGVIAIVHAPGATPDTTVEEVAGEAGYSLRADGDGDLGITVAAAWRGWLGPYLLDVVVRHAAAAGIANIQAEVLLLNTPMLHLLHGRGAVAFEHRDDELRLAIPTADAVPHWPVADERPRVLVEIPGGRWAGEDAAHDHGLTTAFCSGPERRRGGVCPVLVGDRCPLADGADAIVVLLDPDDPDTIAVTAAHRRNSPATPVLVRRRTDATPEGCEEITADVDATVADIAARARRGRQP